MTCFITGVIIFQQIIGLSDTNISLIGLYYNKITHYKIRHIIRKKKQKLMAMEKNEQIFMNQDNQQKEQDVQEIPYIHDTQSEDFISQFLWDENSHQISRQKHQSAPLILQQINTPNQQKQKKTEYKNKKHKRQKSLFHNFQKHLVITLKKVVKIKAKPQDGLIGIIGQQMWQIFLKSHLYTKTILHILYGAEQQQQQCAFTSAMLNKFGYVDLFNKYSEDLVKEAQEYLRSETVRAIKRVNIKQYLSRRRLSKAQQFEDYLTQFVEELNEGPMKKRIPKQKKKRLKAYQKNKNTQEPQKNQQQ